MIILDSAKCRLQSARWMIVFAVCLLFACEISLGTERQDVMDGHRKVQMCFSLKVLTMEVIQNILPMSVM